MGKFGGGRALVVEEIGRTAFSGVQLCGVLAAVALARDWRATLRRSSHRALGRNSKKGLAKPMDPGGELLAAPSRVCL